MGNLKSNKTKEEWDDLVNKTESHSDQVIDIMNNEEQLKTLLQFFVKDTRGDKPWADADDEWIINNIRHVK
jgi:hypothetical protein